MDDNEEIRNGIGRSTELVREISQVLGCSLEALSSPGSSGFDQMGELLRIWFAIEHEQDRNKVLSYMRIIADQAAVRRGP